MSERVGDGRPAYPQAPKTCRPRDAIFPVASTIIYGKNEAILIDAQFQASRARELVQMIRDLGRTLTTVFISHHDPDYYFGLESSREAFPDIRILSPPQTAWLIGATHDAKLAVWKDQMGADAPSETLVPQAMTAPLTLEGEQIEIRQAEDDAEHGFLWLPSLKTVLGGIPVVSVLVKRVCRPISGRRAAERWRAGQACA